MNSNPAAIRVPGVSNLDRLEMAQIISNDAIRFETQLPADSKHGLEPITTAIVLVTIVALRGLSAWLLKSRQNNRIERTIELELPDGTRRTERLIVDLKSSSAPDEQVLKALGDLTHVDVGTLSPDNS
jgi:hypothetical protein